MERKVAGGRRVLRQIADRQPALPRDIAGGLRLGICQNPQHRRFARPVCADKPDPVTCLDAQVNARKNIMRAECLGKARSH